MQHQGARSHQATNPRSYLGHFCIGDELLRSGRLDEGIDSLQRAIALKPDYASAVLNLGTAFTRKGEPERAVELYRRALAENPSILGARAPTVAALHNNLGLALGQLGQEAEGIAQFHEAAAIFPDSLNAHLNLGNVAVAQQRYGDAVAEYETALALSPGNRNIEQRLELARQGAGPQR
jgi:tetratricopeptide (TPR) repeat protein